MFTFALVIIIFGITIFSIAAISMIIIINIFFVMFHFLVVSGFWSFLYFIGFCYLTNKWSNAPTPPYGVNNMQAAIAFSFFAIFPWVSQGNGRKKEKIWKQVEVWNSEKLIFL